MTAELPKTNRPLDPAQRYRLYIDESGDHVFSEFDHPGHRYLCLIGCWFLGEFYRTFHNDLERFKQRHVPHNPDEPVILHRADIVNRRGAFWRLRDPTVAASFDRELVELVAHADFRVVAVVIDKMALRTRYATPAHPYHLALGFLLQRHCGYLNHVNRCGDVMAESRGGREDRLLKDSYERVFQRGLWETHGPFFQEALTSKEIKLKPKSKNIAGLQLADLLGHPVRMSILREAGLVSDAATPFTSSLLRAVEAKFNKQLYSGRIEGYGKVLFSKIRRPLSGPPRARPARAIHLQFPGLLLVCR